MREKNYRETRNYQGGLDSLFRKVAKDYGLGDFIESKKVEMGYEDDNHILETTKGRYFVKIFGGYRDLGECRRYIKIIEEALKAGVNHPKMYKSSQEFLYQSDDARLAVFEFVDGKTFYELGKSPNEEEAREIISEAAKINKINYKPPFVYDEWAITTIAEQYEIVEHYLSKEEKSVIEPLVADFKKIDLKSLPYALVHGDITTTNTMKSKDGKIYIIDFACTNWYPRIMELAVPMCNLLSGIDYDFIVNEYQKEIKLTEEELKLLPLFVNLANSMHIIGAVRERDIYKNGSDENRYWLEQGRKGLGI